MYIYICLKCCKLNYKVIFTFYFYYILLSFTWMFTKLVKNLQIFVLKKNTYVSTCKNALILKFQNFFFEFLLKFNITVSKKILNFIFNQYVIFLKFWKKVCFWRKWDLKVSESVFFMYNVHYNFHLFVKALNFTSTLPFLSVPKSWIKFKY